MKFTASRYLSRQGWHLTQQSAVQQFDAEQLTPHDVNPLSNKPNKKTSVLANGNLGHGKKLFTQTRRRISK